MITALNTKKLNYTDLSIFLRLIDNNLERIQIADIHFDEKIVSVWIEDIFNCKNSIDECVCVQFKIIDFEKVIKKEKLNYYTGITSHPVKKYLFKTEVEISDPINWYNNDATSKEQDAACKLMLRQLFTDLIKSQNGTKTTYC